MRRRYVAGGPEEGVSDEGWGAGAAVRGVPCCCCSGERLRCSATIFSSCRATRPSQRATCSQQDSRVVRWLWPAALQRAPQPASSHHEAQHVVSCRFFMDIVMRPQCPRVTAGVLAHWLRSSHQA